MEAASGGGAQDAREDEKEEVTSAGVQRGSEPGVDGQAQHADGEDKGPRGTKTKRSEKEDEDGEGEEGGDKGNGDAVDSKGYGKDDSKDDSEGSRAVKAAKTNDGAKRTTRSATVKGKKAGAEQDGKNKKENEGKGDKGSNEHGQPGSKDRLPEEGQTVHWKAGGWAEGQFVNIFSTEIYSFELGLVCSSADIASFLRQGCRCSQVRVRIRWPEGKGLRGRSAHRCGELKVWKEGAT